MLLYQVQLLDCRVGLWFAFLRPLPPTRWGGGGGENREWEERERESGRQEEEKGKVASCFQQEFRGLELVLCSESPRSEKHLIPRRLQWVLPLLLLLGIGLDS